MFVHAKSPLKLILTSFWVSPRRAPSGKGSRVETSPAEYCLRRPPPLFQDNSGATNARGFLCIPSQVKFRPSQYPQVLGTCQLTASGQKPLPGGFAWVPRHADQKLLRGQPHLGGFSPTEEPSREVVPGGTFHLHSFQGSESFQETIKKLRGNSRFLKRTEPTPRVVFPHGSPFTTPKKRVPSKTTTSWA